MSNKRPATSTEVVRTPRLLCVHRYHWRKGGAEAVYLDHLRLFRERGWECAEFAMQHPSNLSSRWASYFPSYFSWEAPGLLRRVRSAGRFIFSREARDNMSALLDAFEPDVVHIHGLYQQLTPSVLEPIRRRGIPVVYTAHEYKLLCPAYFLYTSSLGICERCLGGKQWNALLHKCLHDSIPVSAVYAAEASFHWRRGSYRDGIDAFVMPSRFILEKFQSAGFPANKLHYIPNFFETTDDIACDTEAINRLRSKHGRFVLYFGRLSAEKGCELFIRAAAASGQTAVLAGEGPDEPELRQVAMQTGGKVVFLGFMTGAALWAVVEAAEAIVLPSVFFENAPKSVLEAQARGKVVIASNIGGLPEMIDSGRTGFLTKAGDSGHLADTLRRVMALSPAQRSAIGNAARAHATSTFTRARYYGEMSALYRSLGVSTP